jgi:hypothetical protein
MNNMEKVIIIQDKINNLLVHMSVLEKDILDNPDLDIDGKPLRLDVLNDLKSIKKSLESELSLLTE